MMKHKKCQTILELGMFGGILLVAVMTLISYLSRTNEQQYMAMKAFREAIDTAYFNCVAVQINDPDDPDDDIVHACATCTSGYCGNPAYTVYSAGGNVTLNKVEHRRLPAGDFFGKGSRSPSSASAYVYWGVPFIEAYEGDDEEIKIKVTNLPSFQSYHVNRGEYNLAPYYDIDGDGIPDATDDDMDGDGTLNADDDDADGNCIDDETERDNAGLYQDADSDGIPNWQDEQTGCRQGPGIEMVMNYQEEHYLTQTTTETDSSISNVYSSRLQDKIFLDFIDKNGVAGSADAPLESHTQSLVRENGQWDYVDGDRGFVSRTITWTHTK